MTYLRGIDPPEPEPDDGYEDRVIRLHDERRVREALRPRTGNVLAFPVRPPVRDTPSDPKDAA